MKNLQRRERLLKALGYRDISSEQWRSLGQVKNSMQRWAKSNERSFTGRIDLIIESIKDGNQAWAIRRLEQLKLSHAEVSREASMDRESGHESSLRNLISARNELAELKCRILETETEDDLEALVLQVLDQAHSKALCVEETIRYLDPDSGPVNRLA